jgi:hypothetical protein
MTHTITKDIIGAIITHKVQKNCKLQEISQVHFQNISGQTYIRAFAIWPNKRLVPIWG